MVLLLSTAAVAVEAQTLDEGVVVGACKLHVVLDSGPNVGLVPGQPTWTVNGSGPCVVAPNATVETGTISGSLVGVAATSAGCAAGVYRGSLTFHVTDALEEVDSLVVVAVMAGPVLHVTMLTPPVFAGAGVFAETSTTATTACPTTGNTQTTWKGVFGFEGPPPSVDSVRGGSGPPT